MFTRLIKLLRSSSLPLRRAAVACLRQLSQRESKEICDIAAGESNTGIKDTHQVIYQLVDSCIKYWLIDWLIDWFIDWLGYILIDWLSVKVENILAYNECGLPGILFSLLDQEEDKQVK